MRDNTEAYCRATSGYIRDIFIRDIESDNESPRRIECADRWPRTSSASKSDAEGLHVQF
jgi:hypothetical protein